MARTGSKERRRRPTRAPLDTPALRQRALRRRIDHVDDMAWQGTVGDQPYCLRLPAFQQRQAETQQSWVAEIAAEEARRVGEWAWKAAGEEES